MTIHEPMTFVTDLILGGATILWGMQLHRSARIKRIRSRRWWGIGFMASGVGALMGGIFHAVGGDETALLQLILWKGTVYSIGIAGLALVTGAAWGGLGKTGRRWLVSFVLIKFLCYAAWMTTHNEFRYVIYDYAPALVIILLLQLAGWYKGRFRSAPWIGAGIVASFTAAAVQLFKVAPHAVYFNHNDLYHLIQLASFWLLYRGGMGLRDRYEWGSR